MKILPAMHSFDDKDTNRCEGRIAYARRWKCFPMGMSCSPRQYVTMTNIPTMFRPRDGSMMVHCDDILLDGSESSIEQFLQDAMDFFRGGSCRSNQDPCSDQEVHRQLSLRLLEVSQRCGPPSVFLSATFGSDTR
jgi:hypothetical protein